MWLMVSGVMSMAVIFAVVTNALFDRQHAFERGQVRTRRTSTDPLSHAEGVARSAPEVSTTTGFMRHANFDDAFLTIVDASGCTKAALRADQAAAASFSLASRSSRNAPIAAGG